MTTNQPIFVQVQLLLGAVAALLPLAPEAVRGRIASVLDLAAAALRAVQAGAQELEDLTVKLRAVRADIERMVEDGRSVSPARLDEAFAKVAAASTAFRAAVAKMEG